MRYPLPYLRVLATLLILVFGAPFLACSARAQEYTNVSLCELGKDPSAFNHKLIVVTSFVSHGFEDFSLFDPTCPDASWIWLEYGGRVKSGTMYCCGVTATRTRFPSLKIENFAIPLTDDELFKQFDRLVQRKPDSVVHGTIAGRFFAGNTDPHKKVWGGGYGHMGCCSLLAIQQVLAVDPEDRSDLDYRASANPWEYFGSQPDCNYETVFPFRRDHDSVNALQLQRLAESGERAWALNDSLRVAVDFLQSADLFKEPAAIDLKVDRTALDRVIYKATNGPQQESIFVFVSRPFWLSLYAKNPTQVIWLVTAAYKSSCRR